MSHRLAPRAVLVAAVNAAALVTALVTAQPTPAPAGVGGEVATAAVHTVAFDAGPAVATALRASVVQVAMSKVGRPYRYGASGPDAFDCSGLVLWSYKQVGVSLPRTSRAMSGVGSPVSRAGLQPGDLVFFYQPVSHVAIYIGGGRVVHASTAGSPVKVSDLSRMPFTTARRV